MILRSSILAVAAIAALGSGSSALAAPQFVNGGFEAGVSTGWDLSNATNTPGWTLISSSNFPRINLNIASGGPYGANNELRQFETIGGIEDGATSAIAQTLSGFSAGQKYTLSWLQSSEFSHADVLAVTLTGASGSGAFTSNPYPGAGLFWQGWQAFSLTFVPTGSSVTFNFAGGNTGNYEVGVDAFSIAGASVPEPASWAMLLAGFGGLGMAMRNRRRIATTA